MYKFFTVLFIVCVLSVARVGAQEKFELASPEGVTTQGNLTWIFDAKVTILEPSYMEGLVAFKVDKGDANCPANNWKYWIGPETKAIYATLLSALMNGNSVNFVYDMDDINGGNCYGAHLHIYPVE